MAKIIIKCRCEVCQKEIVSDDYVDSYKEVRPVEMLYRNGGMIDVRFYLECETNGKENNGKENNICIMDIPELCSECQQKIGKALRDACDKVLDAIKYIEDDHFNWVISAIYNSNDEIIMLYYDGKWFSLC